MADYLKGLFGAQTPPPPANEDGLLSPTKSPTSTRTSLTSPRLRRLCWSPRSFPCFNLASHPATNNCSGRLPYRYNRCRLHQMVPHLGTNEPLRFLHRGCHSTLRHRHNRTAYMGSADKQKKSKRVDRSSCAGARKGIRFRWIWREESPYRG